MLTCHGMSERDWAGGLFVPRTSSVAVIPVGIAGHLDVGVLLQRVTTAPPRPRLVVVVRADFPITVKSGASQTFLST